MPSSAASSICRIDWRPSPALCLALAGLGLLAGLSLLLSDLSTWAGVPAALLIAAFGLRLALGCWRQPGCRIHWPGRGEPALIESPAGRWELRAVSLHLRGPLAVLAGHDDAGHRHRFVFFPDTLAGDGRRALRLAASGGPASTGTFAVALS